MHLTLAGFDNAITIIPVSPLSHLSHASMEFLRAGETLIRASQPLLLPFLAPTAYRTPARIGAISRRCKTQQWQCTGNCRTFSSSYRRLQQTGEAAVRQDEPIGPSESQEDGSLEKDIFALLDSDLDSDRGMPATSSNRTSRYPSSTFQRGNNPINDRRIKARQGNSVDEILSNMGSAAPRSSASNTMMDVDSILAIAGKPLKDAAPSAQPATSNNEPAPMKLNSTTGRIIQVETERGVDPATAFRKLAMRLAQNNVRKDAQRQRFYERPGLKRKRLKSERWRKRFKEAFQGTVAKVVGLKRQGW